MDYTDEISTIRDAQAGDAASTKHLLAVYEPALRNAARKYRAFLDADDAAQEAMCAFLESLRDFDTARGTRFTQFFSWRVTAAVADAAANKTPFTVPAREFRRYLAVMREAGGDANTALSSLNESRHGMSKAAFLAIHGVVRGTGSLDELRYNDREFHREAGQASDGSRDITAEPLYPANPMFRPSLPTPSEVADAHFALSVVDDRERLVCRLAYGFVDDRHVADAEIAHRMPVPTVRGKAWTRKTVNDTRNAALDKMRAALEA